MEREHKARFRNENEFKCMHVVVFTFGYSMRLAYAHACTCDSIFYHCSGGDSRLCVRFSVVISSCHVILFSSITITLGAIRACVCDCLVLSNVELQAM